MYKNTAGQFVLLYAYDSITGSAKTGLTNIVATVSKDVADFVAVDGSDTIVELSVGFYKLPLTQAETNYNLIAISATSATVNALIDPVIIYTNETSAIKSQTDKLRFSGAAGSEDVKATLDSEKVTVEAIDTTVGLTAQQKLDVNAECDTAITDAALATAASIAALNDITAADVITALKAMTGITVGDTWTFAEWCKILAAFAAGKWQDKTGVPGTYQILDPDDGTTVIFEITPKATTPQRTVTII
jgi:hypothetical protein